MLSDTERKVLRIVSNIVQTRRQVPSIKEIAQKAGRSQIAVVHALRALNDKRFIEWSPGKHDQLQVIKAWEDHHWSWLSGGRR